MIRDTKCLDSRWTVIVMNYIVLKWQQKYYYTAHCSALHLKSHIQSSFVTKIKSAAINWIHFHMAAFFYLLCLSGGPKLLRCVNGTSAFDEERNYCPLGKSKSTRTVLTSPHTLLSVAALREKNLHEILIAVHNQTCCSRPSLGVRKL